jgi:3-hydroxybutyryl-CoA dehydrogenase
MNVVVIGAGLMGSQIGCEYALAGHSVAFVSRDPEKARTRIDGAIDVVRRHNLALGDQIARANNMMSIVTGADEVLSAVRLVVESVSESLETKVEVLGDAGRKWPNAILASNTSSLNIEAIGDGAGAAERTIGTHYWNPPLLMPLVEVVAGEKTERRVVDFMLSTLRDMGKRPVVIERDVPGFVWNRLQLALLREAAWIVEEGVAAPEVVDEIVRDGLARRWRMTGPFETVALGGAATFERISRNLFPVLSDSSGLQNIDRWLIHDPQKLEELKRRRDAELLAELARDRERTRQVGDSEVSQS